jgi:hypothetical protein
MSNWPFEIYHNTKLRAIEKFKDQDRMMMYLHACHRKGVDKSHHALYTRDRFIGMADSPRMEEWYLHMDRLEIQARLLGSDVMGLDEFLSFRGWTIDYNDVGKTRSLDFHRYRAKITRNDTEVVSVVVTKLEDLTRCFIALGQGE